MPVQLIFETHSLSEDNERGIATGWLPGRLSDRGRRFAEEMGERRGHDGLVAVFTSDLNRAVETASLAFDRLGLPILHDGRLRECDDGDWTGRSAARVHHHRADYVAQHYPGGQSWREAVHRL